MHLNYVLFSNDSNYSIGKTMTYVLLQLGELHMTCQIALTIDFK